MPLYSATCQTVERLCVGGMLLSYVSSLALSLSAVATAPRHDHPPPAFHQHPPPQVVYATVPVQSLHTGMAAPKAEGREGVTVWTQWDRGHGHVRALLKCSRLLHYHCHWVSGVLSLAGGHTAHRSWRRETGALLRPGGSLRQPPTPITSSDDLSTIAAPTSLSLSSGHA